MNELKIPTNLETISLNEQTNYRLMEISKLFPPRNKISAIANK